MQQLRRYYEDGKYNMHQLRRHQVAEEIKYAQITST